MISEIKAASDTHLHKHESKSSLVPLQFISSINSDNIRKYRSGNKISSKEKIHNYSLQSSIKSINDNYQKFSNKNLINTHFPIANIQRDSTMISKTSSSSSSQLPTVPKQAGTFFHRLVDKFFSITNTNENKRNLSRIKRKQMNTRFANDSYTFVNLTPKKRRRQRLKPIKNKNNTNKDCVVCRKYRNCFSILPSNSQSPIIFNTNATTTLKTHSILATEPFISLPRIQLEKLRTLNPLQYQTIISAVELIFDTLISNYQQI